MKKIPDEVINAWKDRNGPVVFSTVDKKGMPNSIYATCVSKYNDETIIIANNYFNKTRENIFSGSKGSILFLNNDKKSYQLKGSIKYHTEGEIFDDMKNWNPEKHPGHAAISMDIEEIYCGSNRIL
ncbi:MAG: pyridoxamine 5'-phosphate oxidase family protein [Actinobacteria bacterium]|nr:pyridoxamine 5'-phosphate oxidase family protein [Actinomycetota bacterium]